MDMYDEDGVSLWDLNVIYETSAVTLLEANGKLTEMRSMGKRHNTPGWQVQLEQRIDSLRRRLSFIGVILTCKEQQRYTTHQKNIEHKLQKWYGKTTKENLKRVRTLLKQDLTAECESLEKEKPSMKDKELTETFQPTRNLFIENLEQKKKYKLVIYCKKLLK